VWRNNDDGIDLWGSANVLVENNWAWQQGYNDALTPSGGDGNGFKLGGGTTGDGLHTVRNNLAWGNFQHGFDANSADLTMNLFNNTAYNNTQYNFHFYNGTVPYVLKDNLSYLSPGVNMGPSTVNTFNSWNLGVTVNAAQFVSLDYSGATGPRQADGSLPTLNFLRLAAGSNLIDKGVDVGLPYFGGAPDLGAYEYSPSTDTQPPTVPTSLTATAISTSQINLAWTASTDNVGVVGYNVYRDGVKIDTTGSTAYANVGLAAGTTYSYTVSAFDAAGNTSAQSTSASATTAAPPAAPLDTTAPTVSIASPTGGTVSNMVSVSVNAADNVGVTRVDLRVNGVTAATTNVIPYQFPWNSTTVPNGSVALTAVAFDAAGNSTTSTAVTLNVSNGPLPDTTPPTVSISSPSSGRTVSYSVAVSVKAADNVGVTRFDLRVNGVTVGSSTAAPWQFSWDSLTVANGTVLLTAVAYDGAGNSTESAAAAIIVNNGLHTTTPLYVNLVAPANGTMVTGPTTITTVTGDTSTSAKITQKLYIDGALTATTSGSSLNYKWNAKRVAPGAHTILVTATDDAGNSATKQVQVNRK
jgi:chitodextrinase